MECARALSSPAASLAGRGSEHLEGELSVHFTALKQATRNVENAAKLFEFSEGN